MQATITAQSTETPTISDAAAPLDRAVRQRGLVPPERLSLCNIVIIGVGAIGRQVALQLAAVGAPVVTMFDDDDAAVENQSSQGYWPADIGHRKVDQTTSLCSQIYPEGEFVAVPRKFTRQSLKTDLPNRDDHPELCVFCCVDSINTRRVIWETVQSVAEFFVDGRMSAEVLRVLTSNRPKLDLDYDTTLFDEAEAHVGDCTARSTIYTASIAAGLMIHQFTRYLRKIPTDPDFMFNMLANELVVNEPAK